MNPIIILIIIIPIITIIVLSIIGMPLKFLLFLFLTSCLFVAVFLWLYSKKMDKKRPRAGASQKTIAKKQRGR
jgi:membrane protein implicated in regulation of membrane protease activity